MFNILFTLDGSNAAFMRPLKDLNVVIDVPYRQVEKQLPHKSGDLNLTIDVLYREVEKQLPHKHGAILSSELKGCCKPVKGDALLTEMFTILNSGSLDLGL